MVIHHLLNGMILQVPGGGRNEEWLGGGFIFVVYFTPNSILTNIFPKGGSTTN